MIAIQTDDYLAANRERLTALGYSERQILAYARYDAFSLAKHGEEAGRVVLDHVNSLLKGKRVRSVLHFYRWEGNDLYAKDQLGRICVIPGNWRDACFIISGVVRQRTRNHRWSFLPNGEASTGSVQVARFGEVQLCFPEFEGIPEEWRNALNNFSERT